MRIPVLAAALALALMAAGRELRAGPPACEPPEPCFLDRLRPVGGWHPYGGGLVHWWPRHCFVCGGFPDDYCRKPLPRVCWPPCPADGPLMPAEVVPPPGGGGSTRVPPSTSGGPSPRS
jgi:hypothetical protein